MKKCFLLLLVITFIWAAPQIKCQINNDSVFFFDCNKLKLPINNRGVLSNIGNSNILKYDGIGILYSGGFMITGKSNNIRWARGEATVSNVSNFLPGRVNSNPNDPLNVIYNVNASDPPFGASWIKYADAVSLGADFYDGNNDGVYNPVDLNNNGKWDTNEDRPDFLGSVTAWCVYNDSDTGYYGFSGEPQGLEIQQTVFAYASDSGALGNTIFVRYRLLNCGTVSASFDSVYFTLWEDPDIGDYADDLEGCDTLLNAGYTYSDKSDLFFGPNPPTLLARLAEGPISYIPGVTFLDNNSNGEWDEGVDTPLDSAFSYRGSVKGIAVFPGAMNLPMTSFVHYQSDDPILRGPQNETDLLYYATGRNGMGETINPCTWNLGHVVGGVNCSQVDPIFWYSGDPVAHVGWLNNKYWDQRQMVNTGPFKIKGNKPVEIIAAYVVGRGSTALESVTLAKNNAVIAQEYLTNNFPYTTIKEDKKLSTIGYNLFQNYPNPFNPSSSIKYSIPQEGRVQIALFNVLGQQVKEIFSGFKSAGTYEVNLNAGSLSGGVYFYRLNFTSGVKNFSAVKKLIILK